jgi:hypothetical protein
MYTPNPFWRLCVSGTILTALSAMNSAAAGPAFTERATILAIDSGWAADAVSVKLNTQNLINPAGCAVGNAGYVTKTNDPGRKLYQAQLQQAFFSNFPIRLLISDTPGDCPFSKPRIISVSLCRPTAVFGPC